MISVTLQEVFNAMPILQELADKDLTIKTSFVIARIIIEVEKEYNLFQEQRKKMFDKYVEKNEDGNFKIDENNNYIIKPGLAQLFNSEMNELLQTAVELNCNFINLEDIQDLCMSPRAVTGLLPFIKEKTPLSEN